MKVGSLVECINDQYFANQDICTGFPKKGSIYTIREIFASDSDTGVLLDEIVNPLFKFTDGIAEPGFHIRRFRELQPPMKISIEQFMKVEA